MELDRGQESEHPAGDEPDGPREEQEEQRVAGRRVDGCRFALHVSLDPCSFTMSSIERAIGSCTTPDFWSTQP